MKHRSGLFLLVLVLAGCTSSPPAPTVSSIIVTPVAASCAIGDAQAFAAVARDANGSSLNPQPGFSWTSSLPSVASVEAATGLASCQSLGSTNVTASAGGVASNPAPLKVTAGAARFDAAKFDAAIFGP